jgi:hypothetical protein
MDANESTQSPTPSMISTSSPAPGKVQKSGRRQSTMQAAPENIARALESMPNNLKFEDGTPNFLSSFPLQSKLDASYASPTASQPAQARSPPKPARQDSQSPPVSSCCSQKPKVQDSTPAPAPTPVQNGGTCCGPRSSTTSQSEHNEPDKQQFQQPAAWDSHSYMQFADPQMTSWHNPTVNTPGKYVPSVMQAHHHPQFSQNGYGEMLPPRSQPQISHNGVSLNVTSPPSMSYHNTMKGLGITEPSMDPFVFDNLQSSYVGAPGGDPCHECSCGEDCQCLGCAAHPFNTTTRKHVQEMGTMITFNGDDINSEAINTYQPSPFQSSTPSNQFPYFMQNTPSVDHTFQPNPFNGYSEPSSNLPSGYSSPLSTNHHMSQQLMHPSEYYTLEYPVGLPSACSDITGSCQCGSDCSCVGCLTHSGHNGFSLDMPIPQHHVPDTADQQNSPHAPQASSATTQSSRIPVLDGMSVPCSSPRTLETSMI